MKKSSFTALVMGTVSTMLFGLGMCMALITEWAAFSQGIVLGVAGLALGIITVFVWRKMENKPKITIKAKNLLQILYTVIAVLVLGVGMCMCLVANNYITGTLVGVVGIAMLLALIPMIKGLK